MRKPSQEDVRAAKNFILTRIEVAALAQDRAGELILDAAVELVYIAYRYSVPAEQFEFEANSSIMEEVVKLMSALESNLLGQVEFYALSCTENEGLRKDLLALLLVMGHRNMKLSETIYAYQWRMLRQAEALIAAYKAAGLSVDDAVKKIRPQISAFNTSPELQEALKNKSAYTAAYIANGGKATFPDGSPNVKGVPVDGYNAIKLLFGTAVAQIWMRNQLQEMQQLEDCMGYYVLRGSNYNCALCDSYVGYHEKTDIESLPPYHPNCHCYIIKVYKNE